MDHEETERELRKAGQFPRPFERLFQQGQMFERSYVAHHGLARFLAYSLPLRYALMLGSVLAATSAEGWLKAVGGIVLVTFAAFWVGGPLRRAQAYRNGWVDRGRHDVTEHELVCGDPVSQEAFSHRMFQLNIEVLH